MSSQSSFFKLHHIQIIPVPRKSQEAICELKVWEKPPEQHKTPCRLTLIRPGATSRKSAQAELSGSQRPESWLRTRSISPKALIERLQLSVIYFHDNLGKEAKAGSPAGTKVTRQ